MMKLNYDISKINELISAHFPETDSYQHTTCEAMISAILAGGKRIRPILMYETYRMFCKLYGLTANDDEISGFLAAIEMIHTASLIHDDLPCMDNDTERRGHPTTWVTYGEALATVAADGLFLDAFTEATSSAMLMKDSRRAIVALNILGFKSGMRGMCGGQSVDVEKTGEKLDGDELDFVINLKTGALLEAAMMVGAVLGGASEEDIHTVGRIALNVGKAFQIRDDILDDGQEDDKTTYVSLYGREAAEREVMRLSVEAEEMLDSIGGDSSTLKEIINYLIDREN